MLDDSLLTWWFEPWSYAADGASYLSMAKDCLGQRDGYRLWCAEAQVDAAFPPKFDPAWCIAVTRDGAELMATARLYAGVLAAREHDRTALNALPFAEHKWCASIASTQPLQRSSEMRYAEVDGLAERGLAELSCYLEHGFPGMWARLRLTLSISLAGKVDRLRTAVQEVAPSDVMTRRVQRCWRLCRSRAAEALVAQETPFTSQEELERREPAGSEELVSAAEEM